MPLTPDLGMLLQGMLCLSSPVSTSERFLFTTAVHRLSSASQCLLPSIVDSPSTRDSFWPHLLPLPLLLFLLTTPREVSRTTPCTLMDLAPVLCTRCQALSRLPDIRSVLQVRHHLVLASRSIWILCAPRAVRPMTRTKIPRVPIITPGLVQSHQLQPARRVRALAIRMWGAIQNMICQGAAQSKPLCR